MNLQVFQRRYEVAISSLRGLIEESLFTAGDKSEDSQRILLLDRLNSLESAFTGTTESDLISHAIFRRPLGNVEEAQELFRYLHQHGLTFHPEDDPADLATPIFSPDEARELRHRMREAYTFSWSEYDCPCGYLLSLEENRDDS